MKKELQELQIEIEAFKASTVQEVEAFRRKFVSRQSIIATYFKRLTQMALVERKESGEALNYLKKVAQQKLRQLITSVAEHTPMANDTIEDFTLPPPTDTLGTRHPLTSIRNQIITLFEKVGFNVAEGPEIEDDWHNFTALNFPLNHPARDMQDTFFLSDRLNLRTHTSSTQIRVMTAQNPPIRTIVSGRVFRNEAISARTHCMFHQLEGFYVNEEVSFVELKTTLYYFVKTLFGDQTQLRFRPSYFPFTEPSVEIDINCRICQGAGCNVCKNTGWVEIMGAGMIDPKVLTNTKIDANRYTGFAFGMGIERIAMLKYKINDLRLFTENDMRFLVQF